MASPVRIGDTDDVIMASAAQGGVCCAMCEDRALAGIGGLERMLKQAFIVCDICGHKRCPKATNHDLLCTGSNASGQPGSRY